ncbi:MAG: hypothetical protein GY755_03445 [Chloroflexi bacterium]|nr:hypothetical protein [Chloroflexota bacterium]
MKRLIPFIIILGILLSGCGALGAAPAVDATATLSQGEIEATAGAMVADMIAQTEAAMPTNTMVPPTNTPLPPATPTITLVPTLSILDGSPTVSAIMTPTTAGIVIPTSTQATSSSTFPCTEKPLNTWTGDSVQLSVSNYVKNSTANVFLCITTPYGEAGYISVPVVNVSSVQVPYGTYTATAWVDGKKDFNATTGFVIKSSGNVQIVIENNQIFFRAGCAPNC